VPATVGVPLNSVKLLLHIIRVTPAGKPTTSCPVPPPVTEYVILVINVLIHGVCASVPAAEVKAMAAFGLTVMVPLAVAWTQVPVVVIV